MWRTRACRFLITLSLLFTGMSEAATAENADLTAGDLVQKARQSLSGSAQDNRQEAERLLRAALAVPGQKAASYGDISVMLGLFLLGERDAAAEIRALAEDALQLYSEAAPAVDDNRTATALELLAAATEHENAAEAAALRTRSSALRAELIQTLQDEDEEETAPLRIGAEVSAPRLLQHSEPKYSEEARLAKRQGTVLLSVVVNTSGRVRKVRLVRSVGFGLDEQALAAVSAWQFEPATRLGEPVSVFANVELNFRLL